MKSSLNRRTFGQTAGVAALALLTPRLRAAEEGKFEDAAKFLDQAVAKRQVQAAALLLQQKEARLVRTFGAAKSPDAIFLLASITKPMTVAALMTLFDREEFRLEDPVCKFLPEFRGDGREQILIRHLLTHVSGLPDQLPENQTLRKRHAPQAEFVRRAMKTPLLFRAGAQYRYSSMGILLASEIAHRISGKNFLTFIDEQVFQPLGMRHSALGLGRFSLSQVVRCQTQLAAPESGSGAADAADWDWNSKYWRSFGAPWGGAHASVLDVNRFLQAFAEGSQWLKPDTARLMITNHNPPDQRPRGLGFAVGKLAGSPGCSGQTYGHTGSTGTLAWRDPRTDTTCIVLTTLPGNALKPHPRQLVSEAVAKNQ